MLWKPGDEQLFHGFITHEKTDALTRDIGSWALADQAKHPGGPFGFTELTYPGDIPVPNYKLVHLPQQDPRTATEGLPQQSGLLTRGL